jgi:hypothetical protein
VTTTIRWVPVTDGYPTAYTPVLAVAGAAVVAGTVFEWDAARGQWIDHCGRYANVRQDVTHWAAMTALTTEGYGMTCEDARDRMRDTSGDGTAADARRLYRHLLNCAACRAHVDGLMVAPGFPDHVVAQARQAAWDAGLAWLRKHGGIE